MVLLRSWQLPIIFVFSLGVIACGPRGLSKRPVTRSSLQQTRGVEATHPSYLDPGVEPEFNSESVLASPQQAGQSDLTFKVRQKAAKYTPVLDPHPETAADEAVADSESFQDPSGAFTNAGTTRVAPRKVEKMPSPSAAENPAPRKPDLQAPDLQEADPARPDPAKPAPAPAPAPAPEPDPAPEKSPEKPSGKSSIAGSGNMKPTVYYYPVIDETKITCKEKVFLPSKNGVSLIPVCQSTLAACALQGSCAIIQNNQTRSFNIAGQLKNGQNRFFETTHSPCKYGYGVKKSCLDPFYTIAADLSIYKPGDVIYVPAAAGLKLPNGTQHHGYFIVRDTGRAIKGKGRFDFFSGYYSWRDKENPFVKVGLSSKKNQFPYYLIQGPIAEKVLKQREFPSLPAHSIK